MSATTVTREDLYRLVWETPITRLAAGYGISGTGLKKICDRLDVPVPPRGYWARKEAGQPVVQFRLLKAKAGAPLSVVIHPTPPKEKPAPVPVPADNPRAGVKDGALAVPERLIRPHPVIAAWIDARRGEREASRHRPWGSGRATVPDFSDEDHRRHRILNALFRALEADNHTVTEARHGELEVKLGGKPVSFRLREKLKQVQRPLTDDEKRWGYHAKKGYRTETVGSGFLIFEIQSRRPGRLDCLAGGPDRGRRPAARRFNCDFRGPCRCHGMVAGYVTVGDPESVVRAPLGLPLSVRPGPSAVTTPRP